MFSAFQGGAPFTPVANGYARGEPEDKKKKTPQKMGKENKSPRAKSPKKIEKRATHKAAASPKAKSKKVAIAAEKKKNEAASPPPKRVLRSRASKNKN